MDLRYKLNKFPYLNYLRYKFYRFKFKLYGATIIGELLIEGDCEINLGPPANKGGEIIFHNNVYLGKGALFHGYRGKIEIAEEAYIGPGVKIYGHGCVSIGKKSLIAVDCKIFSANHTIPERGLHIKDFPDVVLKTVIEDDVWLGAGTIVLGGVTVGKGCVVGAGSVVTKNLPPYSIAAGNPAKVIKNRE